MLLQDPDRVLCSALVGFVKTDINHMNVVRLGVLLSQNRLNRGDSLLEAGTGTEEGVVPLTLVSLDPKVSKIKKDNFLASPTLVVKEINQLDLEQSVNLVKESRLKFKKPVKLVKSCYLSEPVSAQKPDFVQPESAGIVKQKAIDPVITKRSGRLLVPVKVNNPRPQKTHKYGDLSRQATNVSGCILSCCQSCSFCAYHRASAKERFKSRSVVETNKACQKCYLCRSMSFCPKCSKCPQCCDRSSCRRPLTGVLASLARDGCKSSDGVQFKRGLHPFKMKPPLTGHL